MPFGWSSQTNQSTNQPKGCYYHSFHALALIIRDFSSLPQQLRLRQSWVSGGSSFIVHLFRLMQCPWFIPSLMEPGVQPELHPWKGSAIPWSKSRHVSCGSFPAGRRTYPRACTCSPFTPNSSHHKPKGTPCTMSRSFPFWVSFFSALQVKRKMFRFCSNFVNLNSYLGV